MGADTESAKLDATSKGGGRQDYLQCSHQSCEKGGLSLNLLSLMTEARVVANEITYNAAISACEKGGQWELALNMLSLMPQANVVANEITYSAAISAYEKGGPQL
eukprot:TRINITY_DN7055_c0_g1_i6.p1 TRINITY_DN7055_c0_g1~~TRINITY_DN7055_c0_g1_i6.p1  ORF type:complete len:105 (-),score=15.20 TRINITY_DN7055_c0_g1_i6:178-492(-)